MTTDICRYVHHWSAAACAGEHRQHPPLHMHVVCLCGMNHEYV